MNLAILVSHLVCFPLSNLETGFGIRRKRRTHINLDTCNERLRCIFGLDRPLQPPLENVEEQIHISKKKIITGEVMN